MISGLALVIIWHSQLRVLDWCADVVPDLPCQMAQAGEVWWTLDTAIWEYHNHPMK